MSLSREELEQRLEVAVAAAGAAAALLQSEFHRPGGPRGGGSHAEVDDEAEAVIVRLLGTHFPGEAYLGEELHDLILGGPPRRGPRGRVWIVDPNDGTSPFLKGFRGSAVAIALVEEGLPVLGVVHAWDGPTPAGDLFSWHQGGSLRRNGRVVQRTWPEAPARGQFALISHEADRKNSLANAETVAPLRFLALPSIAWRMALVAAGEGEVAVSLGGPVSWDLAAGHALILGAGGVLLDRAGRPLRYDERGQCRAGGGIFAGAPALVLDFARRDWGRVLEPKPLSPGLVFPQPRRPRPERGRLARAQGCLLGQLAGDALGSQVEFLGRAEIAARHPAGVREMADGGAWGTLAGQPTDDSEMALHLARCLVREGRFEAAAVRRAYEEWAGSRPFDMGRTVANGLAGRPDADSQANGALMRISPLGIFGALRDDTSLATCAEAEAALTHPHPLCRQVSSLFVRALALAVREGPAPADLHRQVQAWAEKEGLRPELLTSLAAAAGGEPVVLDARGRRGWVLLAWQNAWWQLLHASGLEEGLVDTVGRGGDTDTNAAIAGALLGAVHGVSAVPVRWRLAILACRPLAGLSGVDRPRPPACWPVDALVLAEQLLVAEGAGSERSFAAGVQAEGLASWNTRTVPQRKEP
ncbi:MAG: inositol monophosphatase family protein [bacterium]|jgi:ADP-ribosylglycohydrolase/fructose-1,6-bisphosphatase/inositol monophosphatase family enzyme|nr:inositol monophosphatase family protein [bacterium]